MNNRIHKQSSNLRIGSKYKSKITQPPVQNLERKVDANRSKDLIHRKSIPNQWQMQSAHISPHKTIKSPFAKFPSQKNYVESNSTLRRGSRFLNVMTERKYSPKQIEFSHHTKLSAIPSRKNEERKNEIASNTFIKTDIKPSKDRETVKYEFSKKVHALPIYGQPTPKDNKEISNSKFYPSRNHFPVEKFEAKSNKSPDDIKNNYKEISNGKINTNEVSKSLNYNCNKWSLQDHNKDKSVNASLSIQNNSLISMKKSDLTQENSLKSSKLIASKPNITGTKNGKCDSDNKILPYDENLEVTEKNIEINQLKQDESNSVRTNLSKSLERKVRQRCEECRKKIGIVNSYHCRCGKVYCSQHRYPETHNCFIDFKAEGKKIIEIANPLILPPKLPKL